MFIQRENPAARARQAPATPVRVLHVISGLRVGGAESMLAALVGARPVELEQEVLSLLSESNGYHATEMRRHGVRVSELGFEHAPRIPAETWKLVSTVRRIKPHVVQGWMYHGNVAALAAVALSGRRRATCVAWGIRCSDRDVSDEPLSLRALIRGGARLSGFADVLVANSRVGLEYHMQHGYRGKQTLVVHNGIDTARFRPDRAARSQIREVLGISPDEIVVVHVARVHPMKDHGMLLEVARRLPHVRVMAVGAGTESLADVANVKRLGRRDDIPSLLAASDVIVSTSAYGEGFSNALAEGMATGLVPVSTDVGDSREIIGNVGLLVPPRATHLMCDAIDSICRLPRPELSLRGVNARERIVSRFGLAMYVSKFTRLYTRLAAEQSDL